MALAPADGGGLRPAPSVLLAEHEAAVAAMLVRYLDRDGFDIMLAGTPELALAGLAAAAAAVLDLTMPGLDPRRVRRALRIPVVFLVAPGPRPRGLNGSAGAAAPARRWLIRPFGPRQLVAAVHEVLREDGPWPAGRGPNATPPLETAGLRLDPARRIAITTDREVPLTEGECRVLAALLATPGRPRSRRQLLEATGRAPGSGTGRGTGRGTGSGTGRGTGRTASDRAADVYIAQLRAKLGTNDLIRTVRGAGYAICGPSVEPAPEQGGMPNPRGQ